MAEDLKNKIDQLNEAAESGSDLISTLKKLVVKFFLFIATILVLFTAGFGIVMKYKTEIANAIISKAMNINIHEEVVKEVDNSHDLEIEKLERVSNAANSKANKALKENKDLKEQNQILVALIDGLVKQTGFNTSQNQIQDEALWQIMKKDESCAEVRYNNHSVNRYVMFSGDWYHTTTLQPIIAGAGCSVTIAPFDRNKIKLR